MSKSTRTEYYCDNCHKKLRTCNNELNIVTSKNEANIGWERLHVRIERRHGAHNDATTEQATLCKKCAISLLSDALKRVRKGERASEGTEASHVGKWA